MRAPARFLLGAFGAIAIGALPTACDWREFDTLQNQAPVLAIDAPSGFPSSSDFGSLLLPVVAPPADGSSAAWFLASATQMTGLALVTLDAAGGSSALKLTGSALDDLGGNPVTAMAEIPGTGTALLGAPALNSLLTVDLTSQMTSEFIFDQTPAAPEAELGVGVAAGRLTGAAAPDLVATSTTSIHVFVAGSAANELVPSPADLAACQMMKILSTASADRINRAVVIGNLTGSGSVVAVGTPGDGVAGSVSFFTATASAVSCAGVLPAPTVTSPTGAVNSGFGRALAIGDFDGDSVPDLLVGAPPYGVYLYKGPIAPGAAPTATIAAPMGSAEFGAALAVVATVNESGVPVVEALVGDPGATINGQTGAGNVTIYTGPTLGTMAAPTPVLTDHGSSAGEAYGSAVGALPFCASAPCAAGPQLLPLVGAPSKAFVYFTLGPTDPRAM
jgi:hypothetical protein